MIDTHCHLTDPRLFAQLDGVLQRCADNRVTRVVTIGTDLQDAATAIELCRGHDQVRCAIGVHPNHSHGVTPVQAIENLRKMQADETVVAIGEMGLDYHYEESRAFAGEQKEIFVAQLRLALRAPAGSQVPSWPPYASSPSCKRRCPSSLLALR